MEFKLPFTGIMEHFNCGYILVLSVFTEIALQFSNEMMVTRRDLWCTIENYNLNYDISLRI